MINENLHPMKHTEKLSSGKTIALCRCWHSDKFPYCDGTHRKINEETGDKVGPAVITLVEDD